MAVTLKPGTKEQLAGVERFADFYFELLKRAVILGAATYFAFETGGFWPTIVFAVATCLILASWVIAKSFPLAVRITAASAGDRPIKLLLLKMAVASTAIGLGVSAILAIFIAVLMVALKK